MASRIGRKPRSMLVWSLGVCHSPPFAVPTMRRQRQRRPSERFKRLHRYVRQKLAEIEQVYQYSPVGLVLMDMDYRFVRINERMAEINGLPVEAHLAGLCAKFFQILLIILWSSIGRSTNAGNRCLTSMLFMGRRQGSRASSTIGWRTSFPTGQRRER